MEFTHNADSEHVGGRDEAMFVYYSFIEDAHGAMHRRPLDFLGWLVEVGITN